MGTYLAKRFLGILLIGLLLGLPAGPGHAQAPVGGSPPPPPRSAQQLEELVGRVALYPDDLLAIIGFALVAFPAEYGESGIMTFLVSHHGTVFQKDLGPRTMAIARNLQEFNPDKTWAEVQD